MDHLGARIVVDQLLERSPEKAAELLVRYCQDTRIHNEIATYLIHQSSRSVQPGALSPSNSLNITLAPQRSASSVDSHHSESPLMRQRLARRPSASARPLAPLSPPSTVPSSSSHSSRGEAAPGDYIVLLTFTDGSVREDIVRMRTAPIACSVMREDVVHKRGLTASLRETDECRVFVPYPPGSHAQTQVPVTYRAKLEWIRPRSNSTHSTTFYIVPKALLDVDVVLGYKDSGEAASGVCNFNAATTLACQANRGCTTDRLSAACRPTTTASTRLHLRRIRPERTATCTHTTRGVRILPPVKFNVRSLFQRHASPAATSSPIRRVINGPAAGAWSSCGGFPTFTSHTRKRC
jgi:hypothetical protein